jgi:hypothetical protein
MSLEGFKPYIRREFCNDINCPKQIKLNNLQMASPPYERIRQTCRTDCKYTTWQFHHWLIEKGYLILKPMK